MIRARSSYFLFCLFALISRDPLAATPSVSSITPAPAATLGSLSHIEITFDEVVSGVSAEDLLINGSPAATLSGSGSGPYVFGFSEPPSGTVSVDWTDDHGIAGLGTGAFLPGSAWSYTLTDNHAPTIAKIQSSVPGQEIKHIYPTPSSTVSALTQCMMYFSEAVTGVDATDLRINGQPATSVTGSEAGPYLFTFPSPAYGPVIFSWKTAHGIIDAAGNDFTSEDWSVTLTSTLGSVIISEFLAANAGSSTTTTNGTRDEDFDLSPWIELQNTGSTTVDLTGWSLTNDPDDPNMWILPARTLAAGAKLILWASGKDRKPISGHLHTNFQLAINGGYLALHSPNYPRSTAASRFPSNYPSTPLYPTQRYDYSYGLQAGDSALRYFTPPSVSQSSYTLPSASNPSPTPPAEPQGAANTSSTLVSIAPTPAASVNRGFFNAPFTVILSSERPDAIIRYTTNGSLPLASDTAYTTPLTINSTTVLRFTAFASDSIPSTTVTQTYLFADTVVNQNSPPYITNNPQPSVGNVTFPISWGTQSGYGFPGLITNLAANQIPADYGMDSKIHADPNRYDDTGAINPSGKTNLERIHEALRSLPALSVVLKNDDMFGTGGIYPTSSSANKTNNIKACSLEMFDASGNTIFKSDAGIDNHGNASRDPYKNPKHGFTLSFKGRYGNGRLHGSIFPDSPVTEWDKLILRADFGFSWLHWDGTTQRPRGIRTRDPFCKDTFRDMGCMAGHNRFVNLFINGVYWGTYDIAEAQDEDFAASYFGGEKNSYDIIEQNDLKNGSWTSYREIKRILGWTNAPTYNTTPSSTALASAFTNANYEEIKQYLDVPWHCDYMILHYYIGHEDWGTQAAYDKNWYAIRAPSGTFKYLPWDMENVMNSQTINRVTGATYPPTAIQSRLKKNSQYLLDFADRVNKHMVNPDGALTPSASIARMVRWSDIMNANAICLESARWGDYRDRVHVYTTDTNIVYSWNGSWYENGVRSTSSNNWLTEINRMQGTYFPVRTNNVLSQFRTAGLYPTLNAPEFLDASNDLAVGSRQIPAGFQLKLRLPVSPPTGTSNSGTIYYTTDGIDPRVYYDTNGTKTSSAIAYSAPITLNSTVTIKARTLNGSTWSALRESTYTIGSILPHVVISEIHYHPSSGGTSREFVEIYNFGNDPADLSHWSFDGIGFLFPFGTSLAPNARLVIANNDNPAVFAAANPGVIVFDWFSGSLDNGSERLNLRDRLGNIVCSVNYTDHSPWPTTPDGSGPSLELINPNGNIDSAENWQASTSNQGSPGQPNATGLVPTFTLSEFQTGNAGFVEITNSSSTTASMAGWSLLDHLSSGGYTSLALPPNLLSPGGIFLINTPLNAQQGHILLVDSTSRTCDGVKYGPQSEDYSFSKITSTWTPSTPTPGSANSATSTASPINLRLNEFLADPVPGQSDWLEIANLASQPILLTGLQIRTTHGLQDISFPTLISPASHTRLFCDENSSRGDTLTLSIPAAGGTLTLQKSDATVIDSINYNKQVTDLTSGRLPDGIGAFTALAYASPAAPNHDILSGVPLLNEVLVKNHNGSINPWARRSAWVELRNLTAQPVALNEWSLQSIGDNSQTWTFPTGASIPAFGYLCVWADPTSASSTTNSIHLNSAIQIDSEYEHDYSAWGILLVKPNGQIADRVTWGLQIPDQSIGRNTQGNWSLLANPTQGIVNSAAATLAATSYLRINEWTGRDIFIGSNITSQFSELYNPATLPVSLSKLWLGDEPSETGTHKWQFPSLSFLGPSSHALLLPSDGGNDPARISFNLSSGGEMLILSNENSVIDSVNFGWTSSTRSQGRTPDGQATVGDMLPTPGATNTPTTGSTPVFYQHPRSISSPAGSTIILRAAAYPVTAYQWYRDGIAISGATSAMLVLSPLSSIHNSTYQCLASNGTIATMSLPAIITVLYNYTLFAAENSLGPATADDDGDGVSNLIELVTNNDPHVPNTQPITFAHQYNAGNSQLALTLKLNSHATWTSLGAELSPNLSTWTATQPSTTQVLSVDSNGDSIMRFVYSIPQGQPSHFIRFAVEP